MITGHDAKILDIPGVGFDQTYEALLDNRPKVYDLVQSRDMMTSAQNSFTDIRNHESTEVLVVDNKPAKKDFATGIDPSVVYKEEFPGGKIKKKSVIKRHQGDSQI